MSKIHANRGPNQWILFTQKVDSALDAAGIARGAATVSKQFASSLKDIKPYAEWTDEAIVEAWSTWQRPEQSAMARAAAAPKKARKPMTEQQKLVAKARRNATRGVMPSRFGEFNENEDLSSSAYNTVEQKAVRNLNARESESAAKLIFPSQNHTRRKPTWGIPNVGPGFGGSRKAKPMRKRRRSRKN